MNPPPQVSIVIPTYNREDLITAAVDSALGQSVRGLEVIVVDDGSTDSTAQRLDVFRNEARFRYVRQANQDRSAARNHGARLAEGQWLVFLDSDDRLLPQALAGHLAVAQQQSAVAMTIGGYAYTNQDGLVLGQRLPWQESGLSLANWLFNCMALPGSAMIRRDWFEQVQGYDPTITMAEDWDLYLRLAQGGCPMAWTRQIVCEYRQHPGSSIHNQALHRDNSLRALDKVFQTPELADSLAALAPRARAWVYVVFARRAFAAGQPVAGAENLSQALSLDRTLADQRRVELLEYLFSPTSIGQPANSDMDQAVTPYLPEMLKRNATTVRQAQARAHMAVFFRAGGQATRDAAEAHLRAAIRRDPRWLLNRGVLAYCARRAFRRNPRGAAA
jgi:GT2 family glycosyltransferase